MGLLAGIFMIMVLGYSLIFAFQCLTAYSTRNSDRCHSSTSFTSLGVGFLRGADVNKNSPIKKKLSPVSAAGSTNQYFALDDFAPAIRSPTVRSVA